jgi:predicted acylesterase/phospholipase RssA
MYRRIYLCGGGVNSISHVGCLEELESRSLLAHVKEWMGISAGAFTAMGIVAGYTIPEMKDFNLRFDYSAVSDPDEASGWIVNMGYDTGNRLKRLIKSVLHQKCFEDTVTFKELHEKTNRVLRVFATNLNTGQMMTFDPMKTPDYLVTNAVMASMLIPGYFQPFECPDSGHLLCDGGVITNYPYDYIERPSDSDILYVSILYSTNFQSQIELMDIFKRPFELLMNHRTKTSIQPYIHNTIVTSLKNTAAVQLTLTKDEKAAMMRKGKDAVIAFFKDKIPVRRYSVS